MRSDARPAPTRISNARRFFTLMPFCGAALAVLSVLFLRFGAEEISGFEIIRAFTAFDGAEFRHVIVRDIRLPRLLADVMVGVSLAVSGALMQGNTKNPMADSGLMGISSGSVVAVVLMMAFLPNASRMERIGYSCLGALMATLLIYGVALIGHSGRSADKMVLSGMAISTLFGSAASAVVLKTGRVHAMLKYTAGSSANTVWPDIVLSAPFFAVSLIASLAMARSLTVMNLGEEVSRELGANTGRIRFAAALVVLVFSAVAVIIIGPVGYVGLMVPHIVRSVVGTDYRFILPSSAAVGAVLVVLVDLAARVIVAPLEFPVGVLMTLIGVPSFLFISNRRRGI